MDDERREAAPGGQPPTPPDGDPAAAEHDSHVLPDETEYPGAAVGPSPRMERWRRRSATGAMMTGFALGLREVLETERRGPAIVMETSGLPPRDLAVEADLDNLPPRQSVVKVRRWLLHGPVGSGDDPVGPGDDPGGPGAGAAGAGETGDGDRAPARPTEIRQRRRPSRTNRLFGPKGS